MDLTPNEDQQPFIYIAMYSLNIDPYKWQHELGGIEIEAVTRL